jgi:hypothetical protein
MTDVRYPIEMVNGVPVVAAPAEIDASTADWLGGASPASTLLRARHVRGGHDPHPVLRVGWSRGPWRRRTTGPWPKVASCGW